MRTIFTFLFALVLLNAKAQDGSYKIIGTTNIKEGIAILDVYSKTADTVKVRDGKFEFRGSVSKPQYQSIQVPPGRPHRIVLEPGTITVSYDTTLKDYQMVGTDNNIRLNRTDHLMKPYNDKVAELYKKYNQAKGDERHRLFNECEEARAIKNARARELILADPHFSGFLMMLPYYRDETAGAVKKFLDHFKHFKNEDGYDRLAKYYKGAAQTDFGVVAPDWTRPDDKGKMLSLSSLRGKYVLVDFWYAGCVWCRKMTPHLSKVYPELKDKGLEIVSVSIDTKENEDKWRKAMEEDKAPWLQAWDYEKKLPDEYGVLAYPTMFLLDREGRVVEKIIGYREEPALRAMFAKYIR